MPWGGQARVQGRADGNWPVFKEKDGRELVSPAEYNEMLKALKEYIEQLKVGMVEKKTNGRIHLPVRGVGEVGSLSFAPMCLYTGLIEANCESAIKVAMAGSTVQKSEDRTRENGK